MITGLRGAARRGESRSETINRLLRERLIEGSIRERHAREVEQINRHAEMLNVEAIDVLTYQGDL